MALTLTKEKRFAVLSSILEIGGQGTKKEVLDNIDAQNYLEFNEHDLSLKHNRNELYWRNDLAYVRKGLADNGYIDDSEWNRWTITDDGVEYLRQISNELLATSSSSLKKLTTKANIIAKNWVDEESQDFQSRQTELEQDELGLANQTQTIAINRIKRYQAIVNKLKKKYQGKCQFKNCGFSFVKKNGELYSEAHHLIPLAQGGSQNPSNVVILCANHHRMLHYAKVRIFDREADQRHVEINGTTNIIVY